MYGLDQEDMQLLNSIFSKTPTIDEVVLYGSRAKGNFKPFSDIDITLKGESLSHDDLAEVCYQLSESSLPFFCDVSVYHDLTSPELLSHIDRRGKTIYKRNN